MKKVLILALAVVLSASAAFAAPGGRIGLYSDLGYSDCNLVQALYVTQNVYIVHTLAASGNSAQFKLVHNYTTGVIAGAIDFHGNLTLGSLATGIAITYGGCKALPYKLCTMPFTPIAIGGACLATFEIVPDPAVVAGVVQVVDCSAVKQVADGGKLTVNGNQTCPCIIATEPTSWSRIKSLYQ